MALRTHKSDLAEARAAARAGRRSNRMVYVGGLVAIAAVAVLVMLTPLGLVALAVLATAVGTLGVTGHFDALAPVWDALTQILQDVFPTRG